MKNKIAILFIFVILFIATFLRLYRLGEVPSSPDWDEAALGYNAYSIMQTGRDEYGKFLPIVLRSFDDYKPALYTYTIIPFIKLIDLNIISVRLPSALLGILTVLLTYFLVKELLLINSKSEARNSKQFSGEAIKSEILPLLSSFLLAISPWHIQFSRIAFESNMGVALNVMALLLFLKGLKKPMFLIFSLFFASLNIYVYQSEKVFTPLLMFALIIIFRKELWRIKKWLLTGILISVIVALPMINYTITDKYALMRAKGVSVFSSDKTNFLKRSVEKLEYDSYNEDKIGKLYHNRRVEYFKAVVSGYISHFDATWLFITGDISRHHAPFMGQLYLVELPFLLIGIYFLLFGHFNKKAKYIIFSFIFLVPIPASVTTGVPHSVRTLNFLPMIQIITAVGLLSALSFVEKYRVLGIKYKVLRISIYLFLILFASFNFTYFFNQYFSQYNYFSSQDWQYGYKEAIEYIKPLSDKYDKIVVTNEVPWDQSYMFFLFYYKYDPKKYQEAGGTESGGFIVNHKGFNKFVFRPVYWPDEKKEKSLFIGTPKDFPEGVKVLREIKYIDGQTAVKIVEG